MITINGVSVSFNNKQVLNCGDIAFALGETHGIIGLNGAGKTSFFNIISRFLKPDNGEVLLNGLPLLRTDVAYLETSNFFYSNITGQEYLDIFPTTNKQFNIDGINQLLQLPLNTLIETYSTGMKKKLALLAILKQDKPVYIFDEPFNGLDLESNKILEMIISHLKSLRKTIFISSHILSPLITVCDKIHLLENANFKMTYEPLQFNKIDSDLFSRFHDVKQFFTEATS